MPAVPPLLQSTCHIPHTASLRGLPRSHTPGARPRPTRPAMGLSSPEGKAESISAGAQAQGQSRAGLELTSPRALLSLWPTCPPTMHRGLHRDAARGGSLRPAPVPTLHSPSVPPHLHTHLLLRLTSGALFPAVLSLWFFGPTRFCRAHRQSLPRRSQLETSMASVPAPNRHLHGHQCFSRCWSPWKSVLRPCRVALGRGSG